MVEMQRRRASKIMSVF